MIYEESSSRARGWILVQTLFEGTAKNKDLAHASLNFVPNVRHFEFITYF